MPSMTFDCAMASQTARANDYSLPRSEFDEWIARLAQCTRVLDLGTGEIGLQRPWSRWLSTRVRYICLDIQDRFRPDIIGDIQNLPIRSASVDGILAMSVLEHVPRPWIAVNEMHRVLRKGGLVVGYVPYMWPYHADQTFHDYFRFSDEALADIFSSFDDIRIHAAGGYVNTVLRFLAGFTSSERHFLRFESPISKFLSSYFADAAAEYPTRFRGLRRSPTGYQFLAVK